MRSPLCSHAVVDAWFDTLAPDRRELALELQRLVLAAVPTLSQAIKWGNLVFLHRGSHALAIVVHKAHINLQVFNGAMLAPKFPQLAGSGNHMRHLSCRFAAAPDSDLVIALARACVESLPDRPALRPQEGAASR